MLSALMDYDDKMREGGHVDHRSPSPAQLKALLPNNLLQPVSVTQIPHITSDSLLAVAAKQGVKHTSINLPHVFRNASYGRIRALDNHELITGYRNHFKDLDNLKSVYSSVQVAQQHLSKVKSRAHPLVEYSEDQHLEKISMQRSRPLGWSLEPPIAPSYKNGPYPPRFLEIRTIIVKKLMSVSSWKSDPLKAILTDYDPVDSNDGFPTMLRGLEAVFGRVITAQAFPVPDFSDPMSAIQWVKEVDQLGHLLGMVEGLIYSSIQAYRSGPTKKETILFYPTQGGFAADFSSLSIYERSRAVWMASYIINILLSDLYLWYVSGRERILGLNHTPEEAALYTKAINASGEMSVTIDFTQMDKTITSDYIDGLLTTIYDCGFKSWSVIMWREVYKRMFQVTPDYKGDPNVLSAFSGKLQFGSGWKMTSPVDTIFGLNNTLYGLEFFMPTVVDDWVKGKFPIAALGDDQWMAVAKNGIDGDKFTKIVLEASGAMVKFGADIVFLQMMMPFKNILSKPTKTIARFLNTFFPETNSDDQVPAIARMAFIAKLTPILHHPLIDEMYPDLLNIMEQMVFFVNADDVFKKGLRNRKPQLSSADIMAINKFGLEHTAWLVGLMDQSNYRLSSAQLLELFMTTVNSLAPGLSTDVMTTALGARKAIAAALMHRPTTDDIRVLNSYVPWHRGGSAGANIKKTWV